MLSLTHLSLVHLWPLLLVVHCQPAQSVAAVGVSLSQMLHFCDISMRSLIWHLQKQASENTLARGVFKELEPCVVFILVFIYCHMVEGEKALWPLPMQALPLLPIAKLWAILVENGDAVV